MKFVFGATDAYWWPVTVRIPDPENPGKVLSQVLKVKLLPQDQDEALAEQDRIAEIKGARAQAKAERDALAARIIDWDEKMAEATFTPENVDKALRNTAFRVGIWQAIRESALGEEARLGN